MSTTTTGIHAPAGEYVLTNGASSISFKTRHMYGLGPVKGRLSVRSGNLHIVEGIAGSAVTAVVDATSFSTRNPVRDIHVRSGLFLGVKKNPSIRPWGQDTSGYGRTAADLPDRAHGRKRLTLKVANHQHRLKGAMS